MSVFSETFKFIYVRVPRTGSSSFLHYLETTLGKQTQIGRQHASAKELKPVYGSKWDEFHTFGFIRNPWDWLVSMYNANISDGAFGKELLPGRVGNHETRRTNIFFNDWVYQRKSTPIDWLSDGEIVVKEVRLFEDFIKNNRIRVGAKPHSRYQDWYNDDLAEYVSNKCQKEIEIGGYKF